jgi:hypothetical protein
MYPLISLKDTIAGILKQFKCSKSANLETGNKLNSASKLLVNAAKG